jgi:hypothetical protein
MKRKLASSYRQPRQLKRQRNADHMVIRHMIELYKHDPRLVPPHWLWNQVYGETILRPDTRFVVAGA